MSNTYTLKVIDEFTCIGADCESSCCKHDWNINIEPETLELWNKLENSSLKSQLLDHVKTRVENGTEFSSIDFEGKSDCCHLDDQDKCRIHSELGLEYQPKTCMSYPREVYKSTSTFTYTASMSCPEIARLVIKYSDSDIFVEGDVSDKNLGLMGNGENALEDYLDKWTRLVLQDNDAPISLKLYYIGKVVSDLNAMSETSGLTEQTVIEICKEYKDHLRIIIKAENDNQLKINPVSAGWFWDIIYNFSKITLEKLSRHYKLTDPITSLNIPQQKKSEQDYKNIYAQVSKLLDETRPQFSDLQPSLNQYLKTLFVNMGFPWNPIGGNFIASYIKSVFHFSSTWYLLALIARSKGSVDKQDLARVIYYVERDYFHDPRIANAMKKNPALFNIENYLRSLLDLK